MSDTDNELAIDELVTYCQTQARLLHGQAETLEEESMTLLSEIDEELSDVRSQLDEHDGVAQPQSPREPDMDASEDLADLEALETELSEKQALVNAKQTRRDAFEALAVGYLERAEQLQSDTPAPSTALERIMQFEHDQDAPAYFDERVTLLEAAADSDAADE